MIPALIVCYAENLIIPYSGLYDDNAARRTVERHLPVALAEFDRFPQSMMYGQAFSHRLVYHEPNGLSTYITVVSGRKLCFLLVWENGMATPEMWSRRCNDLAKQEYLQLEYRQRPPWITGHGSSSTLDRELLIKHGDEWEQYRVASWQFVELKPGMTLYVLRIITLDDDGLKRAYWERLLPPGQVSVVLDTSMSFALAGQGLLWEALPLTEISCRMHQFIGSMEEELYEHMLLIYQALATTLPTKPGGKHSPGYPMDVHSQTPSLLLQKPWLLAEPNDNCNHLSGLHYQPQATPLWAPS